MTESPTIRDIQAGARILLICPDCGQENFAPADALLGARFYACRGDDCDYRFDLKRGAGDGLAEAVARFYAAFFSVPRGRSAR
jgi:hypothetical protein